MWIKNTLAFFYDKLRKEKGITQEQFAEALNVSARTVSRWETGRNMPDISLLVTIAEFFDVSIPEIINGERNNRMMDEMEKDVAEKMSDYADAEKALLLKRARIISITGLIALMAGLMMEAVSSGPLLPIYDFTKGACFGLAIGALITMVLYTTGTLAKVRAKKGAQMKIIAVICCIFAIVCLIASIIASIH